mgnify:CR=1 FL=1|jgi:hypothetical protein
MNFKRPSFRRGGSTGIGQLTPRVKANMGFPNFGVSTNVDNSGYLKYLEDMRAKKASGERSGLMELILGPRYTDPNYISPFLKPNAPFFSNKTGFEFLKPTGTTSETIYRTVDGPKVIENIEDIKITSDSDNLKKRDAEKKMQEIIRDEEKNFKTSNENIIIPPPKPENKDRELLSELSMKDAIEGEVDVIKDLLKNTGTSKGEKALLLAKAIRTPGTVADKLEVAGEGAVKLAKEERKQDKALILTAYKNYKAKELQDGKLNTQETAVKNYVNKKLADKNNTKSKNELELEAWEIVIKGRDPKIKDYNKEFAVAQLAALTIPYQDALRDLRLFGNKKDAASKEKIKRANETITTYREYAKIAGVTVPGLAEGGRVNRALGTPEMGEITETIEKETVETPIENVEATKVTAAENVEPMKEVPVMDFSTLRNRLPKEITDDIVQLLANSKEALQDFYYINSQNDVSSFNTKYGVNLILPPAVLA